MVNADETGTAGERRRRERAPAEHAASLGTANLNPFGDLHMVQHQAARLARSLRGVFEPLLRRSLRVWAEPVAVQRFADYTAERPARLTSWLPLSMAPGEGRALLILDGGFVFEALDLFFGGTGAPPREMPTEFSPASEAFIRRLGHMLADPMAGAWETLARITFAPGNPEMSHAMLQGIDAEDAMIVSRISMAGHDGGTVSIDFLYPVSALKPFTPTLTGKVVSRAAQTEPAWRSGLTRAAMSVTLPVRSVLAEPVISLAQLMELKEGDVIPVSFGPTVPVLVGADRLGAGVVGTSNGRAAIRLTQIDRFDEEGLP